MLLFKIDMMLQYAELIMTKYNGKIKYVYYLSFCIFIFRSRNNSIFKFQKIKYIIKPLLNITIIYGIVVAQLTVIIILCGDLTHYDKFSEKKNC